MFCGYACVVYAMRGEFETAAPFIGIAIVLDMLDGRIARMTGTASDFGVQFDSLADVISFGIAPAILSFAWGLAPLGRLGWAAGFLFVTAAAMRLARFNIQSAARRRQALLRRHAEPGGRRRSGRHRVRLSGGIHRLPRGAARARDGARAGRADGQHDPVPQLQDDRPADPATVHRAAADRGRDHADRDASADSCSSRWPTPTWRRHSSAWRSRASGIVAGDRGSRSERHARDATATASDCDHAASSESDSRQV